MDGMVIAGLAACHWVCELSYLWVECLETEVSSGPIANGTKVTYR